MYENLRSLKESLFRVERDMDKMRRAKTFEELSDYEKMIVSEIQAIMVLSSRLGRDARDTAVSRKTELKGAGVSNAMDLANKIIAGENDGRRSDNEHTVNRAGEPTPAGETRPDDKGSEGTRGDSATDGKSVEVQHVDKEQPSSSTGKKSRRTSRRANKKSNAGNA